MTIVWGLALGSGALLVWLSFWAEDGPSSRVAGGWYDRTQDQLVRAGAPAVTPWALVTTSVGVGVVVLALAAAATRSAVIGIAFALICVRAPFALVAMRSRKNEMNAREAWPDSVDHLASGIRAGLSLPEALAQLGERGPEQLRDAFKAFGEDYRATGRFNDCLDALKARLADPVADRIVEALRITRDVGGTDVGRLLRTLSQFLRDEARLRGELEARQSWTVNAARLAVAAPWVVLAFLSTRQQNAEAYNSPAGASILMLGGAATVLAYRLMMKLGRLPQEKRVLR